MKVTSYSAESGDSGIVVAVVIVVTVVLIAIAALLALFWNNWKFLDRLRARVTGLWHRIHSEPNEIRNMKGTGIGDNEQDMFLPQDDTYLVPLSSRTTNIPQSSENTEKDQEDYEPVLDDFSLGADIERIRLFWNRYCDEKEDDMHSCDMILKRMKNRFGDISENDQGVNSDEWKMRKEKITSVELKPDCQVEDCIVLTKGIKDVIERL
uniref:Uncharacterized protein LOC111137565 n=1 Tax=Crassostrea virginica TaxID=6565 RepID=A0A8B8EXM5_CRAVI|nr:uncharacterized protein LOC111137565 [Crassostrea virginica]